MCTTSTYDNVFSWVKKIHLVIMTKILYTNLLRTGYCCDIIICSWLTEYYQYEWDISLRFCSHSESNASEFFNNIIMTYPLDRSYYSLNTIEYWLNTIDTFGRIFTSYGRWLVYSLHYTIVVISNGQAVLFTSSVSCISSIYF